MVSTSCGHANLKRWPIVVVTPRPRANPEQLARLLDDLGVMVASRPPEPYAVVLNLWDGGLPDAAVCRQLHQTVLQWAVNGELHALGLVLSRAQDIQRFQRTWPTQSVYPVLAQRYLPDAIAWTRSVLGIPDSLPASAPAESHQREAPRRAAPPESPKKHGT